MPFWIIVVKVSTRYNLSKSFDILADAFYIHRARFDQPLIIDVLSDGRR